MPDHSEPYPSDAVSSRYTNMAERLGINTHLHALHHYSATELLTAGVDLPTVSSRLGHGGGGAYHAPRLCRVGRRLRPQSGRDPWLADAKAEER